ncbi:MAG: hypothetical protein KC502_22770, partial [Myxococcales bacterium]|nr:hypothetical protein [Myxococcales bacterium]
GRQATSQGRQATSQGRQEEVAIDLAVRLGWSAPPSLMASAAIDAGSLCRRSDTLDCEPEAVGVSHDPGECVRSLSL